MEALNLLLSAEHCVFVIGMDSRAVAAAIEAKHPNMQNVDASLEPGAVSFGLRFLEKFVQLTFKVPAASDEVIHEFVFGILTSFQEPAPASAASPVRSILEAEPLAEQRSGRGLESAVADVTQHRGAKVEDVQAAAVALTKHDFETSFAVRSAITDGARWLAANPRRIKRFVNIFRLQALIAQRRDIFSGGPLEPQLVSARCRHADDVARSRRARCRGPQLRGTPHRGHTLGRQSHGLAIGNAHEPDQWDQARLRELSADPRIKEFLGNRGLRRFLRALTVQDTRQLPANLALARHLGRASFLAMVSHLYSSSRLTKIISAASDQASSGVWKSNTASFGTTNFGWPTRIKTYALASTSLNSRNTVLTAPGT